MATALFGIAVGIAGVAPLAAGAQAAGSPGQAPETSETCTLRVGSEAPYPPFQFYADDGSLTGIEIDLIRAVGEKIGCTLTILPLPWARIVSSIADGQLEIAMNAIHKPERDGFARFTAPYLSIEVRLFVRREQAPHLRLEKIEDLLNIAGQIGTVNGYSYGLAFDRLLADSPSLAARIDAARDHQTNLRKLISGRLSGLVGQTVTVMAAARELGMSDRIVGLTPAFDAPDYHLMVSRASVSEDRFQRIDRAVRELRDSGKVEKLVARYQ